MISCKRGSLWGGSYKCTWVRIRCGLCRYICTISATQHGIRHKIQQKSSYQDFYFGWGALDLKWDFIPCCGKGSCTRDFCYCVIRLCIWAFEPYHVKEYVFYDTYWQRDSNESYLDVIKLFFNTVFHTEYFYTTPSTNNSNFNIFFIKDPQSIC